MRFIKGGIAFRYHGDELVWRWPWARRGAGKFRSSLYTRDFSDLASYWKHVGVVEASLIRSSNKLESFSILEVLSAWVRLFYPSEHVVILMNLEVSAKGMSFWSRLPKNQVEHLLRDVVVLRCSNKREIFKLVDSVPPSFAEAYGFSFGQLTETNLQGEKS